mmetsp:Transcript_99/g.289  ORF Transcript_99/g.289 Transcript_99/m.289 type:complete len:80 (+) Transcript_99:74-313(+)|eukprot:CAMPEP_0198728394 /NCGR_PEP_ID=MMETSP1475-20131203/9044_1 /TAXON_ID= ORGANISM="Unidentified sp., Strain CCMP1999" /NCGR_SAMPLE_ID=MMETSP1475 /ASSEMBLY_ACC=CAM_ASM_001111 /LENGTH=79 /DNA_ID=CAMNT_0044490749 /DNA_START=66 /DNA_END=305 /DNA_ORIENTATION=+
MASKSEPKSPPPANVAAEKKEDEPVVEEAPSSSSAQKPRRLQLEDVFTILYLVIIYWIIWYVLSTDSFRPASSVTYKFT